MPTTTTTRIFALAGLGLTAALAGCSAAPTTDTGTDTGSGSTPADTSAEYTDGTYTADGSYVAPSGQESITVEITLTDDIVTAVTVTPHAEGGEQAVHQGEFVDGIAAEVVGKDIDTLNVSRVGGSSLTSKGFNAAIKEIKAEALVS